MKLLLICASLILFLPAAIGAPVSDVPQLIAAVEAAAPGTVIELAAGRYELPAPLVVKAGTTLKGAGMGKTIITHAPAWKAATATLPDPETNFRKFDKSGYLIELSSKAAGITISHLTLTGPQLHGAIYGWENSELHLHHLGIENFMYAGFRSYMTKKANIHDCTFVDAGQRWESGQPGVKGGITGGGIFAIWISDSEIHNNRFLRVKQQPNEHYYGIKGRQGKRLRIHHNTIETNFSIEFPFENDEDVEIDHNVLLGTVSIPKAKGGPVPPSGRTFHIHHNYFTTSYAIEFPRNGVEIASNLFDFDAAKDGGNLISSFRGEPSPGPASFHNNLVSNPGRGVMWIERPYARMEIRNNHIIARATATPRLEGLFGFDSKTDFSTHVIRDNIIECIGQPRPLFRNDASAQADIENNMLTNVSDIARYQNPKSSAPAGPVTPLKFACGVNGELKVEGWKTSR